MVRIMLLAYRGTKNNVIFELSAPENPRVQEISSKSHRQTTQPKIVTPSHTNRFITLG